MVTEAGGTVSDMSGERFRSDDREILASNGTSHADLLEVIARHESPSVTATELGA